MDYKKDTRDMGLVSHKSSGNSMVAFNSVLSKKCERLATAIYLVTNFLSDTEPMRPRLRLLSLDLVRDASSLKSGSHGVESNVLEAVKQNIFETLSLLELAFIAGLVSEMNFTILKREYAALRDTIEVKKASRESRTDGVLGDNFFNTPETRSGIEYSREQTLVAPAPTTSPKGHSIGQTLSTMSDRNTKGHTATSIPNTKINGPKVGTHYTPSITPRATTDVAKESRRARITKLVKDNREVTIKDIATHFSDLSEKTIQRELVALVETGVLKKFGERRWSRYTLA